MQRCAARARRPLRSIALVKSTAAGACRVGGQRAGERAHHARFMGSGGSGTEAARRGTHCLTGW